MTVPQAQRWPYCKMSVDLVLAISIIRTKPRYGSDSSLILHVARGPIDLFRYSEELIDRRFAIYRPTKNPGRSSHCNRVFKSPAFLWNLHKRAPPCAHTLRIPRVSTSRPHVDARARLSTFRYPPSGALSRHHIPRAAVPPRERGGNLTHISVSP